MNIMLAVRQRYRRTDGQTDGRTTYDSNTALALRASRGKNDRKTQQQKIKEKILAKWPTQDRTAYVWPIQQNTDSTYTA